MARTAVLGLPRVGPDRELKFALEAYWAGRTGERAAGDRRRAARRRLAARDRRHRRDPVGRPQPLRPRPRHRRGARRRARALRRAGAERLDAYFAMRAAAPARPPLEMTKWFDTNYHYLVPELAAGQAFALRPEHWTGHLREARQLGIATRPVVLGPFSFLLLSKGLAEPLTLLDALVPVYAELLRGAGRGGRDARCSSTSRASRSTARRGARRVRGRLRRR